MVTDVREGTSGAAEQAEPRMPACAKAELPGMLAAAERAPLVVRGVRALREKGFAYATRRAAEVVLLADERRDVTAPKPKWRWPPRDDENLELRPGETVTVKSAEEITAMLDPDGRYKGLLFMDEMWKFCGETFVVLQPIERIFSEATSQLHSGIRQTVLLEDVHCDGSGHGECGARCYHMWREVWLRRAEEGA